MKKLMVFVLCFCMLFALTTQVSALNIFKKGFVAKYELDDPKTPSRGRLAAAVRTAKCNLCHVPDEDKEFRNEYGQALESYLDARDFSKTRQQEEPKKVQAEIFEALIRAEKDKSSSGETYGERILKGVLP